MRWLRLRRRKRWRTHSPPLETPAEREKRWQKHLQAIDLRGERYEGEERRNPQREDWARGILERTGYPPRRLVEAVYPCLFDGCH
jgi:hypothetical protein